MTASAEGASTTGVISGVTRASSLDGDEPGGPHNYGNIHANPTRVDTVAVFHCKALAANTSGAPEYRSPTGWIGRVRIGWSAVIRNRPLPPRQPDSAVFLDEQDPAASMFHRPPHESAQRAPTLRPPVT